MLKLTLDEALLIECKEAVRIEKRSTARVLEYLKEIDKRRLWLKEGYSSLFDFCMRYLNYSEGETNRRIQACRLTAKVEEVMPLLESNTLSLSAISLLSPYLTQENAKEILPKVIGQSTREVEKVIHESFPESKKKLDSINLELDDEMKALIEQAKLLASEKDIKILMKKVLKSFAREKKTRQTTTKFHTRYVQKPLAREVKQRDGFRCAYVSEKGIRCNQRAHLQIDHIRPFAMGGSSRDIENLRCLCRAHNLYKAKRDFPLKIFQNNIHV